MAAEHPRCPACGTPLDPDMNCPQCSKTEEDAVVLGEEFVSDVEIKYEKD